MKLHNVLKDGKVQDIEVDFINDNVTTMNQCFSGCTALTGNIPDFTTNTKAKSRLNIINKFPQTPSRIGRGQYI